jgi:hypothetical protein
MATTLPEFMDQMGIDACYFEWGVADPASDWD